MIGGEVCEFSRWLIVPFGQSHETGRHWRWVEITSTRRGCQDLYARKAAHFELASVPLARPPASHESSGMTCGSAGWTRQLLSNLQLAGEIIFLLSTNKSRMAGCSRRVLGRNHLSHKIIQCKSWPFLARIGANCACLLCKCSWLIKCNLTIKLKCPLTWKAFTLLCINVVI